MDKWLAWLMLGALIITGGIFVLIGAAFEIAFTFCAAFMEPIKTGAAHSGFYGTLIVLVAADVIGTAAATLALTVVGMDILPAVASAATIAVLVDVLAFLAC